jgi:hypothetical protein
VANDMLISRHEELVAVRDAPVVLIDDDAVRALLTGVWLRRLGLSRVQKLAGGFDAWPRSDRPTSTVAEMPLGWHASSAVMPGLGVDDVRRWLAACALAHVPHVDSGASYRRGHLPDAVWLPRGWLEVRIESLAPSLHSALLLTCAVGAQATREDIDWERLLEPRRNQCSVAWRATPYWLGEAAPRCRLAPFAGAHDRGLAEREHAEIAARG